VSQKGEHLEAGGFVTKGSNKDTERRGEKKLPMFLKGAGPGGGIRISTNLRSEIAGGFRKTVLESSLIRKGEEELGRDGSLEEERAGYCKWMGCKTLAFLKKRNRC